MSVVDLVHALGRRWVALVAMLALTGGAAVLLSPSPTVYWSNTDVRLVAPGLKSHTNALVSSTDSVIATAGLVVSEVNAASHMPRLATDQVTIVDAGIYEGVLIRLPNSGGQWATNFDQPTINIQVSGADSEDVRARTAQSVAQIKATLSGLQTEAKVDQTQLISAYPSPAVPVVAAVHGSRGRAMGVILVLGSGLSVGTTLFLDQVLLRRRRGRRPIGGRPEPATAASTDATRSPRPETDVLAGRLGI